METLSKELKPVAIKDYDFERQNKNFIWTLRKFRSLTTQSKEQNQTSFHQRVNNKTLPSTQTLMEEFKCVVFETNKLEHRDSSILNSLLPLLVNKDSYCDIKDKFHKFQKTK